MDEVKTTTQTSTANPVATQPTNEVDPVFAQIEGELKTRFELLPTELQQVILSSDYQMQLFEIAKKYKLSYEKLGQLELETTMVILGMTPPDEYKLDIAEQMGLTGEALDNVVLEINEKVFAPIREKLMMLYSEEEVKKGEEFAKSPTNPNAVVDTKKESPYREPITQKQENATVPVPGINKGVIPTFDKNNFDSKNEIGVTIPVKINPDIKPITAQTPEGTPIQKETPIMDPYRELPDGSSPAVNSGIPSATQPNLGIDTNATKEFLKTIPTLGSSITSKPPVATTESALEIAKSLGALDTMPKDATTIVLPQNQAEKLQSIADMKNILSAKITPPKPIEEVEIQKSIPPINTKIRPDPGIVIEKNTQESVVSKTVLTGPQETGELVRNIKLQMDINKKEGGVSSETIQKIDTLIDFKKVGNFMPTDKIPENNHVGDNFVSPQFIKPMVNQFTEKPVEEKQVPGQIFNKSIANLEVPVKKTGFFGKMKNFFGKRELDNTIQSANPEQNTTTINTVHTLHVMPTNMRTAPATEKQPVFDTDVDNVKIFDEVTVQKKL
jgi:hypothetical protein